MILWVGVVISIIGVVCVVICVVAVAVAVNIGGEPCFKAIAALIFIIIVYVVCDGDGLIILHLHCLMNVNVATVRYCQRES